jgi:hypothetical protein
VVSWKVHSIGMSLIPNAFLNLKVLISFYTSQCLTFCGGLSSTASNRAWIREPPPSVRGFPHTTNSDETSPTSKKTHCISIIKVNYFKKTISVYSGNKKKLINTRLGEISGHS